MLRFLASRLRARIGLAPSVAVPRRSNLVALGVAVFAAMFGIVVGLHAKRYWGDPPGSAATPLQRQALFEMLQPVALTNCRLERFGEAYDGGYLMCGNLLGDIQAGYSYGISGYDQWGCDISTARQVTVHEYDCFDTRPPACPGGKLVFHAECVGDTRKTEEGRPFDTISNQLARNGDSSKRIALKIDVEGAEWDSLLSSPEEVLAQIDQIAVEFHGIEDEKSLALVRRLKQSFEVAHIHFNNASCTSGTEPFPSWAYEVLFVSKRLAVLDSSRQAGGRHPLDSPNVPLMLDCQQ